jgi:predicted outer membrane lipoprotein
MATLLMWSKFFYFLRSFEASSYLIRSLIEIAKDMWVFAFVLGCLVLGLADAFGSVSKAMKLKPEP